MEILIIIIIVVWIIIAIIIGLFGHQRKLTFWGAFFSSLFLSPVLAMLFVLASKELTNEELYLRKEYG